MWKYASFPLYACKSTLFSFVFPLFHLLSITHSYFILLLLFPLLFVISSTYLPLLFSHYFFYFLLHTASFIFFIIIVFSFVYHSLVSMSSSFTFITLLLFPHSIVLRESLSTFSLSFTSKISVNYTPVFSFSIIFLSSHSSSSFSLFLSLSPFVFITVYSLPPSSSPPSLPRTIPPPAGPLQVQRSSWNVN